MTSLLRSLCLLLALILTTPALHAQQRVAPVNNPTDVPLRVAPANATDGVATGLSPILHDGDIFDPATGEATTPTAAEQRRLADRTALRTAARASAPAMPRTVWPAIAAPPAEAQRGGLLLTVDNAYDDADANPGDGLCATSFNDCTLRAAIQEANVSSVPVTIEFDITFGPAGSEIAPGVWRIQPNRSDAGSLGPLPTITQSDVVLDALTQTGASCGNLTSGSTHTIRVVLDGSLLLTGSDAGLVASAAASGFVARGFAIGNFPGRGLIFGENFASFTGSSLVECNYIGTDWTGEVDQGNDGGGIHVSGGSLFFLLGVTARNNLVSGNGNQGIYVTRGQVTLADNIIGLDANGLERIDPHPITGNVSSNALGGVRIVAAGVTVDGNIISGNGNGGPGVELGSLTGPFAPVAQNVTVTDNIIGLDRNALGAGLGNAFYGVWVHERASDNDIGLPGAGNRIGNNASGSQSGIVVSGLGTNENRIRANIIGLTLLGTAAPNFQGIFIGDAFSEGAPSGTVIGGPTAAEQNYISDNNQYGVYLAGDVGTLVEGNILGRSATGFATGNASGGINLDGSTNPIVRGNQVSGNRGTGISLIDLFDTTGRTTGAQIENNRVGTNAAGSAPLPNDLSGVAVVDADGTTVVDNVLSGNTDAGLYLEGTTEVFIDGNFIGTDTGASIDLGNGLAGIFCHSADDVRIGSTTGVPFNTIAFNDGDGIFLRHTFSAGACQNVAVLTNRLFDNAGLGIDLAPNGVNPNDADDFDAGANDGTNFPVITSATNDGAGSTVSFTLNAASSQAYRVQLYRSTTPDPSGHGEGAVAVFQTTVTTNAAGLASSTLNLGASQFPVGVWVAGVATPIDGSTVTGFRGTSEFGPSVEVQSAAGPPLTVTITPTNPTPPVVLQRGDDVFFDITFDVGASGPSSFEFWTESVLPNGSVRSPLIGPNTVNVSPPATVTLSFSQRVPNVAPFGSYTYRVEAGTFPNTVLDSDAFAAQIVSGREAGPDDWQAFDAGGQLVEASTVYDFRSEPSAEAASSATVPETFTLAAAYPNPFQSETTLTLDVPEASRVSVAVYDVLGRRVAMLLDDEVEAGIHRVAFDGSRLASGLYLVHASGAGASATQRVTLVR